MAGHTRSKNGVASLAYVPAIHVLLRADRPQGWMPGPGFALTGYAAARKPGHDVVEAQSEA